MTGNDIIEALYSSNLPVPFLSLWIEDCIDNAKDYNSGGAKYNTQYIQIVGLGTITDSLASLKHNIYETKRYSMEEVLKALKNNFKGDEVMQQFLKNKTPKFGNDEDFADSLAQLVFNDSIRLVESYPPSPVRKATRRVYGLPTTCHVYFGSVCEATPDGREAKIALSEGISPVQGADRKGISGVFRSIGKLDHIKSGGTLLNQKLSPDLVHDDEVMTKLAQLIRAYFAMNAHHVQFNVVSADLLKEAQEKPEKFRDLMVRVAGYSDYFVNLPLGLQEEIIKRTEQKIL
jgi:formate C-acetyltransferase